MRLATGDQMTSKPGKHWRRAKRAYRIREFSSSIFVDSGAQPYRPYKSRSNRSALMEQFPQVYSADKSLIISRALLLLVLALIFLGLPLYLKMPMGGLPYILGCWLVVRYGSYLKAIFRLFDSVTLDQQVITLSLLGRSATLQWNQIESITKDISFWDGIFYTITSSEGSRYTYTDKIKYHIDLYDQIAKLKR
jgi:hypothetical protein